METPRVRLGELLVRAGLITADQLEETLAEQRRVGRRLGTLLVENGLVSESQMTQILSQQLSVPWVSLHHIDFSRQLLDLVPLETVNKYCLIPIYVRRVRGVGDALYVAMDDPTNALALEEVAGHAGLPVRAMIAPPSDIKAAVRAYYGGADAPAPDVQGLPLSDPEVDIPTGVHSRVQVAKGGEPTPYAGSIEEVAPLAARSAPVEAPSGPPPVLESPPVTSRSGPPLDRVTPPPHPARKMVALTFLDGTTIKLPAKGAPPGASPSAASVVSPEVAAGDHLTARDLIAALRAASQGEDAGEVLGENVRWEAMFSALLSVLLKKHLIADWEFVEEYRKKR